MDENIQKAMRLLRVTTGFELSREYTKEDQILMKKGLWDYTNPFLITNQVYALLRTAKLNTADSEWILEILWFWNHHACSTAKFKKRNHGAALKFAQQALRHQKMMPGHPNKITLLLYLLLRNDEVGARNLIPKIGINADRDTAKCILNWYKRGYFRPR